MSVLFALAAAIGWGSSDYAGGSASRRSSAVSVVILTHLASAIALVVIATMPGQTGSPAIADLLWGLAAGLGGGFGAMLLFSGLGKGSMSVVAPITAVGAATIPVVAGVLQGESLGTFGLAGIMLALVAIVLVSLSDDAEDDSAAALSDADSAVIAAYEQDFVNDLPVGASSVPTAAGWGPPGGTAVALAPPAEARSLNEFTAAVHQQRDSFELARLGRTPVVDAGSLPDLFHDQPNPQRSTVERRDVGTAARSILRQPGVIEALLSGIGFGLFFVFIARTSESAGHWPLVGARFISVVMFAAGAILATTAVMPDRRSRPAVILAGLLDAAAAVFFVLSTRSGLLSVGAVLASLYPAITVLLARFVGKERVTPRQGIGLVLSALAVSLLAL